MALTNINAVPGTDKSNTRFAVTKPNILYIVRFFFCYKTNILSTVFSYKSILFIATFPGISDKKLECHPGSRERSISASSITFQQILNLC